MEPKTVIQYPLWKVDVSHTPHGEFNDGYYDKSFDNEGDARAYADDYVYQLSKVFCKNGGMDGITHKSVIVTEISSEVSWNDPRAKITFNWSEEIE